VSIISQEQIYGRCTRCGGALINGHVCVPLMEEPVTDTTPSRLCSAVRLYAAAMNLENKDLAKSWECSESTVSRILSWLMS
jgi:hypothetical protein